MPNATLGLAKQQVRILSAVLILAISWCSALGYALWKQRTDILNNAAIAAEIQIHGLEEHISQSLRMLELTTVSNSLHQQYDIQANPKPGTLTAVVRSTPFLRSLSVTDAQGQILTSSHPDNIGRYISIESFYPVAPPSVDVLRVGLPWRGRDVGDGSPTTPQTRISDIEASFTPILRPLPGPGPQRWMLATLNPDYFVQHAWELTSSIAADIDWVRYDGQPLFSTQSGEFDTTLNDSQLITDWVNQKSAGVQHQIRADGQEILTSYRSSNRFPLVILIRQEKQAMLAGWHAETRRLAWIVLPILLALALAIAIALQRQHAADQRKAQLDAEERLAASVFESSREAIVITTSSGQILSINPACTDLTGYTAAEIQGTDLKRLLTKDGTSKPIRRITVALAKTRHWHGDMGLINKQGQRFTALVSINAVHDANHQISHLCCTMVNVTATRLAEQRLKLAASVFRYAREGILITNTHGMVIDVNEAFSQITGYPRGEVIGRHSRILSSGRQDKAFYVAMWKALLEHGHWSGEIWNRRKSGEVYAQVSTISAVRDEHNQVTSYVALFSDISQQKENERQLQYIAYYDALTNLPNRVLLGDRLRQAMAQVERRNGKLALVFLDLDGFKSVNDTHGHKMGDKLLSTVAVRMKQALRDGDTLARLGGDEFVAVLTELPANEACLPVLDRLLQAASHPVISDGKTLQVSASLGVSFYPQSETIDADQLLRQADLAMYQAKLAGKNRFHVFDAQQDVNIRDRNESLENLTHALHNGEFELYYQPKVNMSKGKVFGAEALIRWNHPEHGLLPPARFLPLLEGHPLALEVGYWVIETAMQQVETWLQAGLQLTVSINVDAPLLQAPDFIQRLQALLAQHPAIAPGSLELEVLETSALDDMERVTSVMEACRTMGVSFALDDFGTGYSSLTYLRNLPTRWLKIDQSFVRNMLDHPDDLAILDGVIGLAIAFRREVIAEGVESIEHGEMLLRLGCDFAQGYGIAKPMPAHQLPKWVDQWTCPTSWRQTVRTSREDLPQLFAAVEHRAWINDVVDHLSGLRDRPATSSPSDCLLGQWMAHEATLLRHQDTPAFSALIARHRNIHELAAKLANEKPAEGMIDPSWLKTSVQTLHDARDELLSSLHRMQA